MTTINENIKRVPKTGIDIAKLNGTTKCCVCDQTFGNKSKIALHYITVHKLKYCGICCAIFPTDHDNITHENRIHWPLKCEKCYAEFTSSYMLKQHYGSAHGMKPCDFCNNIVNPTVESYETHLKKKHLVEHNLHIFRNDPISSILVASSTMLESTSCKINKFHCLLCAKDKPIATLLGHFLQCHKFDLVKFVNYAVLHDPDLSEKLPAVCDKPNETQLDHHSIPNTLIDISADQPKLKKKKKNPPKIKLNEDASTSTDGINISKYFTIIKKIDKNQDLVALTVTLYDYDASLVHCIASSEDESYESDYDGDDDDDSRASSSTCQFCQKKLPTLRLLCKHMKENHGFIIKNMENRCRICRKTFATQLALKRHVQCSHVLLHEMLSKETSQNLIKCPFCGDTVTGRSNMR